jgi:outer membrane protein assembly factor BamB
MRAFGLRLAALVALGPGLALSAAGLAAIQEGGHWPQWRGPNRDGISPDTGLMTSWPDGGPPRVWTAGGLGQGLSSVSVANGRVFTMGDRRDGQYVIALDEGTGRELWAARVGGRHTDEYGGPRGTPTVDDELVYVVDTDGDLVCLEAATGAERWRKNMPREFGGRMMSSWRFSESPLIDGDRVVVTPGGRQAGMVAMEKTTGREIWRATIPPFGRAGADGAGYSSIVISHGGDVKQYIQLMGRGVVSVRASDGWFLWGYDRVANNTANIATPVVDGNRIFASSAYGAGSALLEVSPAADGRTQVSERYFVPPNALQNHHGGLVVVDGYVYGGHGMRNGFPVCLDLDDGRMMWERVRGAGTGSAAVAAADGHLYFRYEDGVVALIEANPERYVLKGSFRIPDVRAPSWPHPVITGGRLYLREQDALHVYDVTQ